MRYIKGKMTRVKCNGCERARSIERSYLEKMDDIIECSNCGNKFSVLDGIKNELKSDHVFSLYEFISTGRIITNIEIIVGYAKYIEIPQVFDKVFKVFTTPYGPCHVHATNVSNEGFLLTTSCDVNSKECKIGQNVNVAVSIFGKDNSFENTWMEFLTYSREQYILGDYTTSILLAEIAFESYIDSVLANGYIKSGLDQDSTSRFLVACEMPLKVNPLMNNLFNKKLSDSDIWKDWEKKVLKWRNEIAHGKKLTATKNEAKITYETIIEALFYFDNNIFDEFK